jgi:NitT/TauT family transport system permease protein
MVLVTMRTAYKLAPWAAAGLLVVLWWGAIYFFKISDFILPGPAQTLEALLSNAGPLAAHSLSTLATTLAGFSMAVIFGLALGALAGSSRLAYSTLYPLLIAFNSVPKAALVPILVMWFGVGAIPAVLTAFILSFFPIAVNVAIGFATIEPELRDVLRSLRATKWDIALKIGIPSSMPYFFASLKIAITLAFVGSVIAEIMGGNNGIGNVMLVASASYNVPLVFAALIVVGAMGAGMYAIFSSIEQRITGWSARRAAPLEFGG